MLGCMLLAPAHARAEADKKQVLYINSYQNGYTWSDDILLGIRQTFRKSGYVVDLQVEYMDAKKHPATDTQAILKTLYANKFASTTFDAIIASDNDAFQFLLSERDTLFPGTPVIFCGVNDLRPEMLTNHKGFSGVVEQVDIHNNLEIALILNPDIQNVITIGDDSLSSRAIAAQVQSAASDFEDRLSFTFWDNLPLDEILTRSQTLPDDTILFFIPFYLENGGKYLSTQELLEALYANSNVPIYGAWTFLLGHGILGGRLLDGLSQGETAAQMVVEIFEDNSLSAQPIRTETPTPLIFDWQVLRKFGLTTAPFPKGAQFINRPDATYRFEKRVVWTGIILLSALAIFTIMMTASRHRAVRAEQQLAMSRKMLRSVIDTIPQLIYWKDTSSRYIGVNQRYADFFGLASVNEAVGRSNSDILHGEQFAELGEELDQQVMQSDTPNMHESFTYITPDNQDLTFEVSKVPLHDEMGEVSGVLSTAEDVTERIALEKQLVQSQKMEAVGTFVGGIAHDFNNLLTTVLNSTELALLDIREEEIAQDIQRAHNAAEQASRLVSQILTYARPASTETIPTDPIIPVTDALDIIASRLPKIICLESHLPDTTELGTIDPAQLQQIVMNLCTNSMHAMQDNGGTLTVSLGIESLTENELRHCGLPAGRFLRLTIHDTGPGVPEEMQHKIFDPFYTTKGRGEGTGLGLAIVLGIVQGHGGNMNLTSRPGATEFDILLPFAPSETASTTMHQPTPEGTERILFVEDNAEQLEVITRALTRLGYDVTKAHGGLEAMDILTSGQPFDMVVTDYDMPDITGVDLARTIGQIRPGLPVLLVSGGQDAALAAHGESAVAQMVFKPYTGPVLARAMRNIFEKNTQ